MPLGCKNKSENILIYTQKKAVSFILETTARLKGEEVLVYYIYRLLS